MNAPPRDLFDPMETKKTNLDYYSGMRSDILSLVDRDPSQRILEVGCGRGLTISHLKKNGYASYVVGIEKVEACKGLPDLAVDEFITADVETFDFSSMEKFDCILLLDVLEHLYEPYRLLKRLCTVLSPSGRVIVSIPNIRNWGVLKKLIFKGRLDYTNKSILDRTHIRFFTKKSFLKAVEEECPLLHLLDYRENMENNAGVLKHISLFREFFVCQHVFKFGLR